MTTQEHNMTVVLESLLKNIDANFDLIKLNQKQIVEIHKEILEIKKAMVRIENRHLNVQN